MTLLEQLNSLPMFAIVGVVILFILGLSIVFMVKSYRAGVALGMDRVKMRRAITSSVTFTLLPSISILLGVIALSGSLSLCPGCVFRWWVRCITRAMWRILPPVPLE